MKNKGVSEESRSHEAGATVLGQMNDSIGLDRQKFRGSEEKELTPS